MKSKRVIFHSLIAEFIPILFNIPAALFLSPEGEGYIPIMIPLPFLLVYVILLIVIIGKRNASKIGVSR